MEICEVSTSLNWDGNYCKNTKLFILMDTWIHSNIFKDAFIRLDSFMCLHFVLMLICNWAVWRFQHGLPLSCHKPQISCRVIFSHQQTNKKQEASFPLLPTKSLHRLLCPYKSSDSTEKYKNKLNVQNHKQVAFIYNLMELLLLKWRNCLLNFWGVDWNGKMWVRSLPGMGILDRTPSWVCW